LLGTTSHPKQAAVSARSVRKGSAAVSISASGREEAAECWVAEEDKEGLQVRLARRVSRQRWWAGFGIEMAAPSSRLRVVTTRRSQIWV
jgi:hypothetical protein